MPALSPNKKLVETYLNAGRSKSAGLMTEDVEWVEWGDGVPPTGSVNKGKAAVIGNPGDDKLRNVITRMTEEGNVVVAEGICHVTKPDGNSLRVRFCNIFELKNGKVKRLDSFGALLKDTA
ncbi:MAG TPA: nuclear transport factor 2 family protein [Thermoplasmata archaeon]|nr:nuclear transport factor 2 family protein [Thermoplasmata archaeon]